MLLVKFIRNLLKQLKSDLTPNQIATAVALGALMGLTPAGLHWMLLFTLAILINCSMGAFLLSFALLKPVSLLLAPLAFRFGTWLLGGGCPPAEGLVRMLNEAPVLAFMGYDRYIVAGAYAIAIPIAAALFPAARLLVLRYRGASKRLGESAGYQKAMKFFLFRFVHWILAGKDKEEATPKKRFILLRPFRAYMLPAIPALYVALTVGAGIYAQIAVRGLAAGAISKALGVNCTFGDIHYSFFGQRLAFKNFQLPDPSRTKENMAQIGGFEADLGFIDLLSGRVRIEKLAIDGFALHAARKEDGALNVTDLPAAQPADPAAQSSWQEYLKWIQEHGKDADWAELYRKYGEYRAKAAEAKKAPQERKTPAYDPDLRWDHDRSSPLIRVEKIELKNCSLRMTERGAAKPDALPAVTRIDAEGTEISTQPGWNGTPMMLTGTGLLADGTSGKIAFRFSHLPAKTDFEASVESVPLADLKPLFEKSLPVIVENGAATLTAKGGIVAGAVDAAVNLRLDALRIAQRPDSPKILGLDAENSKYAVMGINAYGEKLPVAVGVAVTGPTHDPQIQATVPFLEIAKKGLEMLGKKELQKYIDKMGGEIGSLKNAGVEKTVEALKTGDLTGVKDVKTEAENKVKDALDLFKKKKK